MQRFRFPAKGKQRDVGSQRGASTRDTPIRIVSSRRCSSLRSLVLSSRIGELKETRAERWPRERHVEDKQRLESDISVVINLDLILMNENLMTTTSFASSKIEIVCVSTIEAREMSVDIIGMSFVREKLAAPKIFAWLQ